MNIHNLLEDEDNSLAFPINRAAKIIADSLGVTFDRHKKADLTWAKDYADGPTIVFERVDHTGIINRETLSSHNVRLAKMYHVAGARNNFATVDGGRMFLSELTDKHPNKCKTPLSDDELSRLTISPANFLHYKRMDKLCEHFKDGVPRWEDRKYDFAFVGTTVYKGFAGTIITHHRRKALQDMKKLAGRYSVMAESGRPFQGAEYLEFLGNVKVMVCPWGWGESTYRDYEALIAGCKIIKPSLPYSIMSVDGIYCTVYEPVLYNVPNDLLRGDIHRLLERPPESDLGRVLRLWHYPAWLAGKLFDLSITTLDEMNQ